jgi:solute carrier family 25 thiamine pyrophosphate transporter 19
MKFVLQVYRSLSHACGQIWEREGLRGFYRGLTPSLLQIFPQMGLQFGFYSLFTGLWNKAKGVWFDSVPG